MAQNGRLINREGNGGLESLKFSVYVTCLAERDQSPRDAGREQGGVNQTESSTGLMLLGSAPILQPVGDSLTALHLLLPSSLKENVLLKNMLSTSDVSLPERKLSSRGTSNTH